MHVYQSEHVLGAFEKERWRKDYKLRHVYLSDSTSPWNNSALMERILVKFYNGEFYYESVEIIPFWLKSDKNIFHIKAYTYLWCILAVYEINEWTTVDNLIQYGAIQL